MPLTVPSSPSMINSSNNSNNSNNNNDNSNNNTNNNHDNNNPNSHDNTVNNWILLDKPDINTTSNSANNTMTNTNTNTNNPSHTNNIDNIDMMTTTHIPHLDFTIEASKIVPLVKHEINTIKNEIDNIISSIPRNQRTFTNTIEVMSHKETEFSTRLSTIRFLQYVSTDPLVRQASVEASILLDDYFIERYTRRDIYELVKDVARVSCPEILSSLSLSTSSTLSSPLSLSTSSTLISSQSKEIVESSSSHPSPHSSPLTEEQKRLIKKTLIGFKRNGLELSSDDHLQQYKMKQKRLAQLATEFSQTMNEDQTRLVFTEKELEGCSPDFLASLAKMKEEQEQRQEKEREGQRQEQEQGEKQGERQGKGQGQSSSLSPSSPSKINNSNNNNSDTITTTTKYIVTMSYPDVSGVLRRAINQDTRRQVDVAFNSRCPSNIARLEEAIQIRRECAQLLGYKNHASYQLEERLAKSPEIVNQFEHDLMIKLKPLGERELSILKSLKNKMMTMTIPEMKLAITDNKNLLSTLLSSSSNTSITTGNNDNDNHCYRECGGCNKEECKNNHGECKEDKQYSKEEKQSKCTNANKNQMESKTKSGSEQSPFNTWDLGFYSRILEEMQCSIDEDLIRQYFPLDHVITEMLNIYQQVLGLIFTPTTMIPKWHSSVQSFKVQDAKSKDIIGFFYLDLFPRDGKYTHAACFPIHEGYQKKRTTAMTTAMETETAMTTTTAMTTSNNDNDTTSNRQLPISAIVANFTKPIVTKSSTTLTMTAPASTPTLSTIKTKSDNKSDNASINNISTSTGNNNNDGNNNASISNNNGNTNNDNDNTNNTSNNDTMNDIPSLLKHSEVIVLFHELGHAMHSMCSLVQYSMFHGTSVETDFVEAPSQMLENWCWESTVLKRLGKHYKTGQPMPQSLIDNLIKTRKFLPGLSYLRQIMFGMLDMIIHSIETKDLPNNDKTINSLYARLSKQVRLIEQDSQVHPASSFGHLMGGYDAGYYGYLWSEVFSADMYATRFMQDPMNHDSGYSYRQEILQPGGSRDGMDSLKKFLGREPLPDAFYKSIGL